MAIDEQPRENLIRDAVAYQKRILVRVPGFDDLIFWGQRIAGGWSIYFGEEPVFQFNGSGELRRAFMNGVRYAARDGKLFQLARDTSGGKVEMIWQFNAAVEKEMGEKCRVMLKILASELKKGGCQVIECVPSDAAGSNLCEMACCLEQVEVVVSIAKQANA